MNEGATISREHLSPEHRAADARIIFGFWAYLMTDLVLFASLFAVYAVFRGATFGGPAGTDIFSARFVLAETLILLTSSFTCGLGILAARSGSKNAVLAWFGGTFALGALFLAMELSEFARLAAAGNGWQKSAFLSSYFTLVGTHGLHVALGLVWMLALLGHILWRGLTRSNMRKLMLLSLFWHFLDIVWIFIFTIVYLMGII
jgi:cytochrome o ubiquinol oxidase subunit 3